MIEIVYAGTAELPSMDKFKFVHWEDNMVFFQMEGYPCIAVRDFQPSDYRRICERLGYEL